MSIKRKAGDILAGAWNKYQTDGTFQDIVETLGMAGGAAAAQFLQTTPQEIAISTLIGAGGGLLARPALAELGYAGGQLDKMYPNAEDYGGMASLSSPRIKKFIRKF